MVIDPRRRTTITRPVLRFENSRNVVMSDVAAADEYVSPVINVRLNSFINKGGFAMGIEILDILELAHTEKRRKNVFNTPRFHAWMHYYKPGQ